VDLTPIPGGGADAADMDNHAAPLVLPPSDGSTAGKEISMSDAATVRNHTISSVI